jgi:hypothetical protein
MASRHRLGVHRRQFLADRFDRVNVDARELLAGAGQKGQVGMVALRSAGRAVDPN